MDLELNCEINDASPSKFNVEATNLFRFGLSHISEQHGSKDGRPGTEKDLVTVEDSALALHLHISEVFAVRPASA